MKLPFCKLPLCRGERYGSHQGGTRAGPYLMELSEETSRSRSESSVSLGGGGGSLSGTAVKAGDFLEKNTSCHLGKDRSPDEAGIPLPWPCSLVGRCMTSQARAGGPWGEGSAG